jgi:hypothetical protein
MTLSDNHGSVRDIHWKILGIKPERTVVESEARSFHIEAPLAPTIRAPLDGDVLSSNVPPTVSFSCNSNVRFQIQFSSSSDMGNPIRMRRIFPIGRDPNVVTDINRTLTLFQWAAVKKRVREGTGYIRIKAWDGINRCTLSAVNSFTIE